MRYYPINLDIQGQTVVVIGGGEVAFRKIEGLLEAGAKVRVFDKNPLPQVKRLAARNKIMLVQKSYSTGDLGQALLAIAATDDPKVNRAIQKEAAKKKILLNVVDHPEFCNFSVPSRINRGEFMVTVSTGGDSPALSKKVREDLEAFFGPEYGVLVDILGGLRKWLASRNPAGNLEGKDRLFTSIVRSPILTYLRQGDRGAIQRLLQSIFGEEVPVRSLVVKTLQNMS